MVKPEHSPEATPDAPVRTLRQGPWLALAAALIVLDQLTKAWVLSAFELYERMPIIAGLFDFTLVFNRGAAFSFLAGADGWQRWFFTVIGIAASVFIVALLRRATASQWLYALALTLILGGAIGNVIDRLVHGAVVDFILVYQHPWYFPAFNVADSAITLGAILLILDEIIRWRHERQQQSTSSE